jgi:D-alanyl-D-alanine carboxypeptidase/D-alanyl-D-alanine-endopeptidase (penicillin-binding protein 4)
MRLGVLFLVSVSILGAASPLAKRLDGILQSTPASARAHWGVMVVDLLSGRMIYTRNFKHHFVPASNTKLFSTALALERLGPDHRMVTRLVASGSLAPGAVLDGDLRLLGGGDPSLSGREYPYQVKSTPVRHLEALERFADSLAEIGVRRIRGDVIGDDTAYVWSPYPPGWAMDDATWEYGAPVSALVINDNRLWVEVAPGGKPGETARVKFDPPLAYFSVDNRVRTGESGAVRIQRSPGSLELLLRGGIEMGAAPFRESVAVDDPALFAAIALRDAVLRRGIAVEGRAVARHRWAESVADLKRGQPDAAPGGVELASRESPPLRQIVQIVNKVSQNLHAELLLRETARVRRNIGSREAGLEEMKEFLRSIGIGEDDFVIHDGSGLSRLNLLTPEAVVKLLRYMDKSPNREAWLESLPVGGEDGTLSGRFRGTAAAGRLRAKTGTLSHVSALGGYLERPNGRRLAFSVFVNNAQASSGAVRAVMDKLVAALM